MHRQQKPHNRGAASTITSTTNNTTSPPPTKRPPFHRHTSSTSSTSTTTTNTVTPSNTKKGSSTAKPQRPPLHHRKSASAHQLYHNNLHHKSHQSLSKLLGAGSGPVSLPAKAEDERLEMATSFLQYCAMCEKQITVPSNSVLYCSESCRRKDSCKPLSASSYTYTMSNTNMDTSPSLSMSPSLRSSPTLLPVRSGSLARIPSDLHDSKTDLDPTEWKPVIHGYGHEHGRNRSSTCLASSDAWNYLSQFHFHRDETIVSLTTNSAAATKTSTSTPSLNTMPLLPFRRPTHRSTLSLSTIGGNSGIPSLVHTPSTTASSVTSSPPSTTSDYIGASAYTYEYSAPPTPTAVRGNPMDRPLPPRHNPSFSTSGMGATKGVELVVPHIITPVEQEEHEGGVWLKA